MEAIFKKNVLTEIDTLKQQNFGDIALNCIFGKLEYKIIFVTSDCINNDELIKALAKWRKEHEYWFPAQFRVTEEGTKRWLEMGLIEVPDRLLFMLAADDEWIGHIGLFRFNYETRTCEIDNILRGSIKYPGIMKNAVANMMEWGKETLGLRGYSLQVMSDNEKAIKLYKELGFKEVMRKPLIKVQGEDRVDWTEAPAGYNGVVERSNVEMGLTYE